MAVAPEEKINFGTAGPAGPERFEAGVAGYEARAFRGLGVFSSTPYEVNDDSDSVQMLQRSTQVGEFYRMAAPKSFKKKEGAAEDLPGQYMDIVIYDEEMDKHVHITVREALKAAMHGKRHTEGPANGGFFGSKEYLTRKYQEAGITTNTDLANEGTNLNAKEIADRIEAAGDTKTPQWHPVEIIIARPFIEHLMMSAVIAVAGRDTGATLFGPAGKFLHHSHTLSLSLQHAHMHTFYLFQRFRFLLGSALLTFCLYCCSQTCRSPPTPRSRPSRVRILIIPNAPTKPVPSVYPAWTLQVPPLSPIHPLVFSGHYTCQYANADSQLADLPCGTIDMPTHSLPSFVCLSAPSPSSPSRRTSWCSATSCAPVTWRVATLASSARRRPRAPRATPRRPSASR